MFEESVEIFITNAPAIVHLKVTHIQGEGLEVRRCFLGCFEKLYSLWFEKLTARAVEYELKMLRRNSFRAFLKTTSTGVSFWLSSGSRSLIYETADTRCLIYWLIRRFFQFWIMSNFELYLHKTNFTRTILILCNGAFKSCRIHRIYELIAHERQHGKLDIFCVSHQTRMTRIARMIYMLSQCIDQFIHWFYRCLFPPENALAAAFIRFACCSSIWGIWVVSQRPRTTRSMWQCSKGLSQKPACELPSFTADALM